MNAVLRADRKEAGLVQEDGSGMQVSPHLHLPSLLHFAKGISWLIASQRNAPSSRLAAEALGLYRGQAFLLEGEKSALCMSACYGHGLTCCQHRTRWRKLHMYTLGVIAMKSLCLLATFMLASGMGSGISAYAAGLSGRVADCPAEPRGLQALVGPLAAAIAGNIVGAAIDSVVNHLNADRAANYSVTLPEQSPASLFANNQCLYVSSTNLRGKDLTGSAALQSLGNTGFLAVIKFKSPKLTGNDIVLHPIIKRWSYKRFLDRSCPLFRNCTKRDLVVALTFLEPTEPNGSASVTASAIGVTMSRVTPKDVQSFFSPGTELPWFKVKSAQGPVNIRFSLSETSKPGAVARAIATALQGQKGNLTKGATTAVESAFPQNNGATN